MFKDFHRRLQRDLKKIVDARVLASEARLGGDIRVSIYMHHVVWLSLSLSLSVITLTYMCKVWPLSIDCFGL